MSQQFLAGPVRKAVKEIVFGACLATLIFAPSLVAAQAVAFSPERAAAMGNAVMGLIPALQASPGCLGVEVASTQSGKQVIFAWFENRKALLAWYYSDVHKQLMSFTGTAASAHPLADTPDNAPILAIASVTVPGAKPGQPPTPEQMMSIPQVAIELYAPVSGGAAAGGRFAPASVPVPGLKGVPAPAVSPQR